MCISPSHVWVLRGPKYEQIPVPCKTCWRCKQNRVNDYVARSLAEAQMSQAVCTVTLTYAPRDDLADKLLHPRHFQLFMKLLRRSGHKVRYLVAGEYGSLRGRAHFHALLFFTHIEGPKPLTEGEWRDGASLPRPCFNPRHLDDPASSLPFSRQIPQKRMVHIREWPHGHITADWSASEKAVRYVCKYLLHEDKNSAWFSLSKKPALGAAWFARKAEKARELGVLPSSFEYLPPGGSREKPYLMTGATRRDYLAAITTDPARRSAMSEWVLKSFDKYERQRWQRALDALPFDARLQAEADFDELSGQWAALDRAEQHRKALELVEGYLAASKSGRLRRHDGQWWPEEWVEGFGDVETFKAARSTRAERVSGGE